MSASHRIGQKICVKALFPERPSLFALFGGAVALFGDFASFLTGAITPPLLMVLFAVATAGAVFLCLRHSRTINIADEKAVENAGKCFVCDAFRFSLCAAAIFALMMIVGGGKTATESVGETLGLIKEDVEQISDDVTAIRETTDSFAVIARPQNAADDFHNAWIYQNVRRDGAKAMDSLKALYGRGERGKMDSAELYFTVGRVTIARDDLIEEMRAIGRRNRDGAMLVVAARNAPDDAAAKELYEEARQIDPSLPFAWWDMQRPAQPPISGDINASLAGFKEQKAQIDAFIERIDGRPAGAFFFLPQHQPDFDALARQNRDSLTGNISRMEDSIGRMSAGVAAERARKETKPEVRFRWQEYVAKSLLEVGVFVADADQYAWRFNGGDWLEGQRIELYHEQPRSGRFELRWRDRRTGEWFGPFVYDYNAE
jgi:hypothetical protein